MPTLARLSFFVPPAQLDDLAGLGARLGASFRYQLGIHSPNIHGKNQQANFTCFNTVNYPCDTRRHSELSTSTQDASEEPSAFVPP